MDGEEPSESNEGLRRRLAALTEEARRNARRGSVRSVVRWRCSRRRRSMRCSSASPTGLRESYRLSSPSRSCWRIPSTKSGTC